MIKVTTICTIDAGTQRRFDAWCNANCNHPQPFCPTELVMIILMMIMMIENMYD